MSKTGGAWFEFQSGTVPSSVALWGEGSSSQAVARGQVMLPGRGPGLRGQILSDGLSSVTQG